MDFSAISIFMVFLPVKCISVDISRLRSENSRAEPKAHGSPLFEGVKLVIIQVDLSRRLRCHIRQGGVAGEK